MWPILMNFLRAYAPFVTLPAAAVIGFVGYKIESLISDKYTPSIQSIEQQREERRLKDLEEKDVKEIDTLKEKKFVPRSIFEKNVSPSLQPKSS